VHAELLSIVMPVLFIIFAVLSGADATAGEEDRRTIDLLLANPISRTRVVLEKFAALTTVVVAMGVALVLTLLVGGLAADLRPDAWHLVQATGAIVLLAVGFGALALALGAWRGRRGLARGLAAAVAAGTYLLGSLALLVSSLSDYRYASPFYYAIGAQPLRNGLGIGYALVLVVSVAVPAVLAVALFERRDLAS
jgi:ABC-2 type transport system permease protein